MSKKSVGYIFIFLFFVYVMLNIYASQNFNPLFFHLVERPHKSDVVTFLKKIQNTAYFSDQLALFTYLYGSSISNELNKEKESRSKTIAHLEGLLNLNPHGRDVLVQLAILYYENNQPSRAKNYYQQAKTIDPEVTVKELEGL